MVLVDASSDFLSNARFWASLIVPCLQGCSSRLVSSGCIGSSRLATHLWLPVGLLHKCNTVRPVPGHRQAFVIAFVTNIVERWLVEISHASGFARSILSMPGLRHSTKAV